MSQNYINTILRTYSQIRELHNDPPFLAPILNLDYFIAKSANFTLLLESEVNSNCSADILSRTASLRNRIRGHQLRELYMYINLNGPTEKFEPGQRYPQPFSFTYCDYPRREFDTFSSLIIFRSTVDTQIWCCLICA